MAAILVHVPAAFLAPETTAEQQSSKSKISEQMTQENCPNMLFSCEMWLECRESNAGHSAPKAGALSTAQHPDMKLWNCLGGFTIKI